MNDRELSRRAWLGRFTPAVSNQAPTSAPASPPGRMAVPGSARVPRTELVNVLEFEAEARRALPAAVFSSIAGSDRSSFDRVTIHPRLMVPTTALDLTLKLFDAQHFAPILVSPMASHERFHASGAVGTAQGSSAAQAVMIASNRMGATIDAVAGATKIAPWFQVFDRDRTAADDVKRAVAAGCKVIVVTVGLRVAEGGDVTVDAPDWNGVTSVVRAAGNLPVVVKGIRSPVEADMALGRGAAALIVSDYPAARRPTDPTLTLVPLVAERVKERVPILADGNFRRGTDIVKVLALGAKAVLIGRPVMWGLSAYGSDGVQGVLEMLQTELARYMAMSGRPSLASLDRTLIRIHSR